MEIHSLEQLRSGNYKKATVIKISQALTAFPEEIFEFTETLEILDLSGNLLSEIPESILSFKKLKILFLSNNHFTQFPLVLGKSTTLSMIGFKSNNIHTIPEGSFPETLQWLILTNNCIEHLPASIGKCTLLQKVALAGNKLTQLPPEMANCRNLGLLRISANNLKELPQWLLTLPKLAWLAYSGNPCTDTLIASQPLPEIHWKDISLMEQLGEGASGVISKATLHTDVFPVEKNEVAIKIFKGEVTSDGYPEDEMSISTCIPLHTNLVRVLGKISHHPQKKDGLIFQLIPASYRNLGIPPSFATCTRDTFKKETSFSLNAILKIVAAIADAAQQLHTHGIMHGDLYAHNILIDQEANALFGDFGAATPYTIDGTNAKLLQGIEVRAFGYLMEDLLNHITETDKQLTATHRLIKLKESCLNPDSLSRPDFKTITRSLNNLFS